jgi:eukaryotic-like serine/threonine-protein kinase
VTQPPPSPKHQNSPAASSASSRPSTVSLGSLPSDSGGDHRFIQDRVALFFKVTFFISGMFLVATTAGDWVRGVNRMTLVGRTAHVVGTLTALVLWRLLRGRRTFSVETLHGLDSGGTLGICLAFATMGHHALQPYGFYTGLLAVTHVSISRAMIVPSLPKRTLLLAILGFSGFIVSRAILPISLELPNAPASRGRGILEAVLWSTAGVAVATVASRVIYGLREKALEARKLGQYALEQKIGQGGMGQIYRARHAMLRRPTAVKLLSGNGSEAQLRRFEREVQLTARLTHPNTISIYDYGRTPDGVFYYAMELLDGLTLEDLVTRHGAQSPARVIHILSQVVGALKEAHGIGLIHRDIKPANIYLCRRGDIPDFVKVLDFGLVREVKHATNASLSGVDSVVGTPLYLSPEAILKPNQIDARADIYGLGAVAYFLATGTPVFAGDNVIEICGHHLHTPPEPPSRRGPVPADLERVILACLAKDPGERPRNAALLGEALGACVDAKGWRESDAEAWWASVASGQPPQAPPLSSGEQPRLTMFRVDLEARLDRLEEYLEEEQSRASPDG